MTSTLRENPVSELIRDEAALEERLSRPTPGVLDALRELDGDVLVLGASGKMGPTLARMARRALDELGRDDKVIAVARFSDDAVREYLQEYGVETVRCDLMERAQVLALPTAPNVLFLAGQKFGTSEQPENAWAMNTLTPASVAEHYADSRIVAFSTGCVYPLTSVNEGGSCEDDELGPPGDYANSCVGRERVFTYFSRRNSTPVALFRLNYAIDLRYGVLLDVAQKVFAGAPVDVTTGYVNVIWQGDANARALQCLAHAASPPFVLNVTGAQTIAVRELAGRFADEFGRKAIITGEEASHAWLSDASRSCELFGPPSVSLEQMIAWVAHWVSQGGATLDKPTHYEARDGKF